MSEMTDRTTLTIEIDPEIYEAPASSEKEALERSRKMAIRLWPQVTAVMLKAAVGGSVPHAKFVFDCWNPSKTNEKPKAAASVVEEKEKEETKDPACQLLEMFIDALTRIEQDELDKSKVN